MVADYVAAGFAKIHLDASMACGGRSCGARRADCGGARRSARGRRRSGRPAGGTTSRQYTLSGPRCRSPGGAAHGLDATSRSHVRNRSLATLETHRRAFARAGIASSFARVIALVVQPGVEFDHHRVVDYQPVMADGPQQDAQRANRRSCSRRIPPTTSRQAALSALVNDGFAILKVGPALTFAMREALYGLDHIALETDPSWESSALKPQMERIMLAEPKYWLDYYRGGPGRAACPPTLQLQRSHPILLARRGRQSGSVSSPGKVWRCEPIAEPLISQFLPRCYQAVRRGIIAPHPQQLIFEVDSAGVASLPRRDRREPIPTE